MNIIDFIINACMYVHYAVDILLLLGIAAAVVLVAAVLFVYIICKKKSCIARNSSSVVTQGKFITDNYTCINFMHVTIEKRSPLLSSSDQNGSDSNVPECSPVPGSKLIAISIVLCHSSYHSHL